MGRIFHRIQVIQIPKKLIEAVNSRQELVQVAQMILAELTGRVAHGLKRCGNGHSLFWYTDRRARLADGGHACANWQFTSNEVGPSRRTACFGVVVGETHPLSGELVEVGCTTGHHTLMISTDVKPADVIAHDDNDIRFFGRYLLLRLCGRNKQTSRQSDKRYCRRLKQALPPVYWNHNVAPVNVVGKWISCVNGKRLE